MSRWTIGSTRWKNTSGCWRRRRRSISVEGRLVREPIPEAMHGWLVAKLGARIGSHAGERGLGIAVIGSGFVLVDDPPTVRGPDVAFNAREHLPAEGFPRSFWQIPPDLAIEVVSPPNTRAEIREKGPRLPGGGDATRVGRQSAREVGDRVPLANGGPPPRRIGLARRLRRPARLPPRDRRVVRARGADLMMPGRGARGLRVYGKPGGHSSLSGPRPTPSSGG